MTDTNAKALGRDLPSLDEQASDHIDAKLYDAIADKFGDEPWAADAREIADKFRAGPDYDTRDQEGRDEGDWPEPQDPGYRREPPDLDQSDYEADGARMAEDAEDRRLAAVLRDCYRALNEVPGYPCTFAGCNCFYYPAIDDRQSSYDATADQVVIWTGWFVVPIPEDAEEIIDVHDHRTAFDQGQYLPGWNGKPFAREPEGPTNV